MFNGYLNRTVDFDGLAALPLFLSCRAAIRAKTSVTAAALTTGEPAAALYSAARDYLHAAVQLLQPPRPALIAIGGLSGSGKSSLARRIAPSIGPVPGAVVLRSDELRKRLCGVGELTRLGTSGYMDEVSRLVYDMLAAHAADVVRSGHNAVVDAVFLNHADRAAIEGAAALADVPFVGLWLDAPEGVLLDRIGHRGADASDADAAVVRMQLARDPGAITWDRLDASADEARITRESIRVLESRVPGEVTLAA